MAEAELTNCDIEPIHIPGGILAHGAMLVIDAATFTIVQAAGDTDGLLGRPAATLLGSDIASCLTVRQIAHLRELSAGGDIRPPRHLLDPMLRVVADRPADASVHHSSDGLLVIEWEAADLQDPHAADPLSAVQAMLESISRAETVGAFCDAAALSVRRVTGYDRVMVYRFLEDGSGWVVAESRAADLRPMLDLHFPASDIPKQARALYARNWLRLIGDVDRPPAPLVPALNPKTRQPLDMSFATLRDVSPLHREYLRNMGVAASMSISVMRGNALWGLIACHHATPRLLPRHLRAICELFGSMFSLQLEVRERAASLDRRLASRQMLQALMRDFAHESDYSQGLIRQADRLLQYLNADGLGLRVEADTGLAIQVSGCVTTFGATPPSELIEDLTGWLADRPDDEGVFITDRLGEIWPPARPHANVAAGLLAISVSREPRDFVMWFRPEAAATVTWGGDPHKPMESSPQGGRLSPRKSFDAWKETVYGRSSPWTSPDADAAFDLRTALLDIVLRRIDIAARDQARAREREQLLMAELDHRVKNSLAVVQALVRQSGRHAQSLKEYMAGLEQRIRSMARAHSLLMQSRWQGVSLRMVLREEVDQYNPSGTRFTLSGGDVILEPKIALALSLGIHELATNAAKYGALSAAAGHVTVAWGRDTAGDLAIRWTESGGPKVVPPKSRGFGSTLIERALAMETGGRSATRFDPGGVRCDIVLPGATITTVGDRSDPEAEPVEDIAVEAEPAPPAAPRILVVEDAALIVMLIEQLISDIGWTMVGPATRLAEALTLARSESFDAAVLDINLDGDLSWDVAAVLLQRGIPFIFSTGYDSKSMLPPHLAHLPVMSKPFLMEDLERRLRGMISGGQLSPVADKVPG